MPFGSVTLRPGINVEATPTLNEAGYSASSFGRFRAQLFEKLGGWTRFYQFVTNSYVRCLNAWQDLAGTKHLAIGSETQLGVITNGSLLDITPQTISGNRTVNVSTTSGSSTVTIVDATTTNVTIFDSVEFLTPISVGGIILTGVYPIKLQLSSTSYQIQASRVATSTVSNGGTLPTFGVTNGSTIVDVTLADHGASVGGQVVFGASTSNVGGGTIGGTTAYEVVSVTSTSVFSITVPYVSDTTGTVAMNGGSGYYRYYIGSGPLPTSTGYSIGTYSSGAYSIGQAQSGTLGTPIITTDWTLPNWGEVLLACPKNGGIYAYNPEQGFTVPPLVGTAPSLNTGIFVSNAQQILVAFGSTLDLSIGLLQDPLLLRWSDSGDYTNWVASSQTQAGNFRIPSGSKIVGAIAVSQQNLVWTDTDLWAMNYVGPPLVYGFTKIGAGCGLAGMHAAAQLRDSVYWMGMTNFYTITGNGVEVLPCNVWDAVFQDLDTTNAYKAFAAANTPFNEIWFFYPSLSGGTGECDKYVKMNITESGRPWDYGDMDRMSWTDISVLGNPIASAPSGTGSLIYQHETSTDADGLALTPSFTSGYFYIAEGEEFAFVDMVLPDMKWGTFNGGQTAQVNLTFNVTDFPGDTPRTYGPYPVTQAKQYVTTRFRGRQMSVTVSSTDAGSFWRLGKIRYRFQPDGRR